MDDVTHGWVPADSMEGGFPSTGNEIIGAVSAAAAAASALHQTAGRRRSMAQGSVASFPLRLLIFAGSSAVARGACSRGCQESRKEVGFSHQRPERQQGIRGLAARNVLQSATLNDTAADSWLICLIIL